MLLPACITRLTLELPVAVARTKLLLTVIKSVACRIMVEPAEIPLKLPPESGLSTVAEAESSAKSSEILDLFDLQTRFLQVENKFKT